MTVRVGVALALLLALPAAARAHRLHAEARLDQGQVLLEVYFSDGTPAAGAEVTLRRVAPEAGSEGAEQVLARGQTDAGGRFRWSPPAPGTYELEVVEPGLHRARVEVTVAPGALSARAREDPAADPAHPTSGAPAAVASAGAGSPTAGAAARGAVPWGGVVSGLVVIALLAGLLAAVQRGMRGSGP